MTECSGINPFHPFLERFPSRRASNAALLSKDKNSQNLLHCRGHAEEDFFHFLSHALQPK